MQALKIGDRVNVENIITKDWQEKYNCENAFVSKVENNRYLISADDNTIYSKKYYTPLGWLNTAGYKITKIDKK